MRERFEQRLFRIFAQAGYSPVQLLTITPEEMVEIPGITVPNIRAVLCVQNKVLADRNKVRSGRLVEELLKEAEESRCCHECTAPAGHNGGPAWLFLLRLKSFAYSAAGGPLDLCRLCRMDENSYPLSQWRDTVRYLTGDERDFASVKEIKAFIKKDMEAEG